MKSRLVFLACILFCAPGCLFDRAPSGTVESTVNHVLSSTRFVCADGPRKSVHYGDLTILHVDPLSWSYGIDLGNHRIDRMLVAVAAIDVEGVKRLLTVDMERAVWPDTTIWTATNFPYHSQLYAVYCDKAPPTLRDLDRKRLDEYWTASDGSDSSPRRSGSFGIDREAWKRTLGVVPPFTYPLE